MHKRQIFPKEEDRKWLNQRERSYCVQRPIMAFPPYHSNHTLPLAPVYPMWGQSGSQTAGMQIWSSPGYPMWQPTAENWHWKPFPRVIFFLYVIALRLVRCRYCGYGCSLTCG